MVISFFFNKNHTADSFHKSFRKTISFFLWWVIFVYFPLQSIAFFAFSLNLNEKKKSWNNYLISEYHIRHIILLSSDSDKFEHGTIMNMFIIL